MPTQNLSNVLNQVADRKTREAMRILYDELKLAFDAHTHAADGGQAGTYYTSPPRSNTATLSAGTAVTF